MKSRLNPRMTWTLPPGVFEDPSRLNKEIHGIDAADVQAIKEIAARNRIAPTDMALVTVSTGRTFFQWKGRMR